MPTFRICKRFTVESGHMLSRHPDRCRFPHGHTRTIEVVVQAEHLDDAGMVVDFKALKLALEPIVEAYDHAMAVNSEDPLLPAMRSQYPEGVVVFDNQEPTTEAFAERIFKAAHVALSKGFVSECGTYRIEPGRAMLERVRVWETPTSWAEYGNA